MILKRKSIAFIFAFIFLLVLICCGGGGGQESSAVASAVPTTPFSSTAPSSCGTSCAGEPTQTSTNEWTVFNASCGCVNDAIQNYAKTGDTIHLPANGTGTWSGTLTITKPVTINGNGTTLTSSGSLVNGFFAITGFSASNLVRITGFTFSMAGASAGIRVYNMTGGVGVGQIRIDHNTFHKGGGDGQIWFAHGKGLIDNNYFYNGIKGVQFTAGSSANQNESWESLAAGTAHALYIENNNFIANADYPVSYTQEQVSTYGGGKLVVRYNTFDGRNTRATNGLYEPIMTHGNAGAGLPDTQSYWQQGYGARRGQSVVEIYNNTMMGNRFNSIIVLRGSANLVYNNTMTKTSTITPDIYLREEEFDADGFVPLRTTWPSEDQVHNTFLWNNTINGTQFNSNINSLFTIGAGLQKDRDVFFHKPCAAADATDGTAENNTCTHGKATFTGANGASGSYPTNGSLYPTAGTMQFTPTGDNAYYGYTPYTYPHPLSQ